VTKSVPDIVCAREATIQVSARAGHTTSNTTRKTTTKANGSGGRVRYNVAPLPDPPKIERRRSSVHGWGVFALETIPKNKRIIDYAGERITAKQSTPREVRYLKQGHIWCFTLNRNWAIDAAVDGNAARFINHSCRGNCYVQIIKGVIWIRASRTIRKGEELSYNYHTDGAAEIPCRCRPGCQGML
jgi:uncharacterized protein